MSDQMTQSLEALDQAEQRVAAAVALGRRLLAAPHPGRPIYQLGMSDLRLNIWAGLEDVSAVEAWAEVLQAPIEIGPSPSVPTNLHHSVEGDLDGARVRAWTITHIPIADARIVEDGSQWRVMYVQGDARKSVLQPTLLAAQDWVERYTRPRSQAVPA